MGVKSTLLHELFFIQFADLYIALCSLYSGNLDLAWQGWIKVVVAQERFRETGWDVDRTKTEVNQVWERLVRERVESTCLIHMTTPSKIIQA